MLMAQNPGAIFVQTLAQRGEQWKPGAPTMKRFSTTTRVRYAETDASGIVYYNNYFVYFEVGRVELFRQLGLPYDRRLPIVEARCRYHASARFDDLLRIETFVEQLRTRAFRIGSRVYRDRQLLVEGHVAMATVDDQGQLIPLPDVFRETLEPLL